MKSEQIILERSFTAPPEKVWKAITDLVQMKQWYFPMLETFKPEAGFETQFNVNNSGKDFLHIWKVTEVILLKKISYEWRYRGYPGNSLVSFELSPDEDKTKLTLTHSGLESFQGALYPDLSKENFVQGWTQLIGTQLKDFVEKA